MNIKTRLEKLEDMKYRSVPPNLTNVFLVGFEQEMENAKQIGNVARNENETVDQFKARACRQIRANKGDKCPPVILFGISEDI